MVYSVYRVIFDVVGWYGCDDIDLEFRERWCWF